MVEQSISVSWAVAGVVIAAVIILVIRHTSSKLVPPSPSEGGSLEARRGEALKYKQEVNRLSTVLLNGKSGNGYEHTVFEAGQYAGESNGGFCFESWFDDNEEDKPILLILPRIDQCGEDQNIQAYVGTMRAL